MEDLFGHVYACQDAFFLGYDKARPSPVAGYQGLSSDVAFDKVLSQGAVDDLFNLKFI
jgi:hypothetical protein